MTKRLIRSSDQEWRSSRTKRGFHGLTHVTSLTQNTFFCFLSELSLSKSHSDVKSVIKCHIKSKQNDGWSKFSEDFSRFCRRCGPLNLVLTHTIYCTDDDFTLFCIFCICNLTTISKWIKMVNFMLGTWNMKGIEIVVKCERWIDQHDANDWFINNENWACTKKGAQANKISRRRPMSSSALRRKRESLDCVRKRYLHLSYNINLTFGTDL